MDLFVFILSLVLSVVNAQRKTVQIDPSKLDICSTLKMVHVTVRNGQHTPDRWLMPGHPKYERKDEQFDPYGPGELTEEGKDNMYETGVRLRNRYACYLGSTAVTSYVVNSLGSSSSSHKRSRISALLMKEGLRNSEKKYVVERSWSETELDSVTKSEFDFQVKNYYLDCPKYIEEQKKYLVKNLRSPFNDKYKALAKALKKNCDIVLKSSNYSQIHNLYELYLAEYNTDLKHPDWLTADLFKQLQEVMELYVKASFESEFLKMMSGGIMVQNYFDTLEAKKKKQMKPCNTKMFLMAGNGGTLAPLFAAFSGGKGFHVRENGELFDVFYPQHTGMMILETHKVPGNSDYWLKFFYSTNITSNYVELEKRDCGYPCRTTKLRAILKDIAIGREELKQKCAGKNI